MIHLIRLTISVTAGFFCFFFQFYCMLCQLDSGIINHNAHIIKSPPLRKNKSIDGIEQCGALCKKYSGAGGVGCRGQDFSIKPAVKNECYWHLEALSQKRIAATIEKKKQGSLSHYNVKLSCFFFVIVNTK